ncbi:MAG: FtsW/RodA/SpoVE family cell cycle protein [Patescibacteria group bacterium]
MNKRSLWNIDLGLLLPVFVLLILSLITLFSVSFDLFINQLLFSVISLAAFVFFSQVNYKVLQLYGRHIYIVSIVLLVLVLLLGIESRGAIRWIEIFGFRVQFSEILKPFLAISLASYLAQVKNTSFALLLKIFIFLSIISFLIFVQPDLGSAVIYILVAFFTLIFFGFPIKYFLLSILSFVVVTPIAWKFLHDYQRERILTFIDPGKDPLGTSYNAIQSIIAVGSGMFLGKGLGQGTQSSLSFLPERHTDFIFATISEQLGFIGAIIILITFGLLLYKIFDISQSSDDPFCKIFSGTVFFIIFVQFFVNVGMNIGILPVVGVTLPFMSYGGSSLLSSFILLGLLSSVQKVVKEKKVLEIR